MLLTHQMVCALLMLLRMVILLELIAAKALTAACMMAFDYGDR